MRIRYTLTLPVLATVAAALIAPALAEMPGGSSQTAPGQSMGAGRMGHAMMSRDMMSGGCAGMMQSMNGGAGPPNSQWQKRSQDNAMPN
jgi:hypothetical protein